MSLYYVWDELKLIEYGEWEWVSIMDENELKTMSVVNGNESFEWERISYNVHLQVHHND